MKLTLYRDDFWRVAGMTEKDAKLGNGRPYADFIKEFDGSIPWMDFEMPPEPVAELDVPLPELSAEQSYQLARVVYDTALNVAIDAGSQYRDLVDEIRAALPDPTSEDSGDWVIAIERIKKLLPPEETEEEEEDDDTDSPPIT